VFVDLIELAEKYRQSTNGRELPRGGQMRQLMRTVQRWGIARRQDDVTDEDADVEQPFVIVIRPAIADVLGETPLQRLALFGGQSAATAKTPTLGAQQDARDEEQVADDTTAPKEDT
jgi:hypothetical protein